MGQWVTRQVHAAKANLELCQHEIERLRARDQAKTATIRRLKRRIADLQEELALVRGRPKR